MNQKTFNRLKLELLQVTLIFISFLLAYLFPLHLFLIAYTFIGPLHYITDINWLKQKRFFTPDGIINWMPFGIMCTLGIFIPKLYLQFFSKNTMLGSFFSTLNYFSNAFIFLGFGMALVSIGIKDKKNIFRLWLPLLFLVALGLNSFKTYALFFGLFLPTLVHVYVFTLLFMLYGIRKSKNSWGYVSVFCVLFFTVLLWLLPSNTINTQINAPLISFFTTHQLDALPMALSNLYNSHATPFFDPAHPTLRKFIIFISFAYCYHYLNWFSKTTAIKWHKNIDLKSGSFLLIIYAFTIILYAINFKLGLLVSLFGSFLHVILEFPLSVLSLKNLRLKSLNQ